VEEDAFAEMEDVGEGSGRVPGFGEIRVEIHLGVALDQAVEKESGEALGLCVRAEAGVEVGGIGFDDEGQGGGIGWGVGARGEEEDGEEEKEGRITQRAQRAQSSQRREERGISHFADSVRDDGSR